MRLFLQQCRGILVANIILAHRKHFFWKLFFIQLAMLAYLLVQLVPALGEQPYYLSTIANVQTIQVIILTSQFLALYYIDNGQKFVAFQKAYGLNIYAYVCTWIAYCIGLGLLLTLAFCGIVSTFTSLLAEFYHKQFGLENYINIYPPILMAFLSNFCYFLCFSVIIPYKQIGLKLITGLTVSSYVAIVNISKTTQTNLNLIVNTTPIGRLMAILYEGQYPLKIDSSISIVIAQTLIPLAIVVII
jgi:hypothetical protein